MEPILLHVGFHKTATTYFQTGVFDNPELGFVSPWRKRAMWVRDRIIRDHPEDFDAKALRAEFDKDQSGIDAGLTRVLSDERFTGTLFGDWRMAEHTPARLKAIFPEARVMIGIREQKAMILSSYMQYLRLDGQWGLHEFIRSPSDPSIFNPVMQIDRLKYDRMVGTYVAAFGAENTFVMPLEMLSRERDAVAQRLGEVLGRESLELPKGKRNASVGPAGMSFLRRANAYVKRSPTELDQGRPRWLYRQKQRAAWKIGSAAPKRMGEGIKNDMKDQIEATIGDYYADSNGKLQLLIDRDLAQYGYAV